jgi:type IV secretory pathway protease TraF
MSLAVLLLIGVVSLLVTLAANTALIVLGSRLWKVPNVTILRAAATAILLGLVNLALAAVFGFAQWMFAAGGAMALRVAQLIANILVFWGVITWSLRTGAGRAALVGVTVLIPASILSVALALGIRLVALEAFDTPTGGMAPGMLGAHSRVTCDNCGLRYAVGMSDRASFLSGRPPMPKAAVCDNCGHTTVVTTDAPLQDGDRFLVDKTSRPNRWDNVVFSAPDSPDALYVKRLVGLPNETVQISEGDIFINGRRMQKQPGAVRDAWLLVHDTKFAPEQIASDTPRWAPAEEGSRWTFSEDVWTFEGRGRERGELFFDGSVTDDLAYNASFVGQERRISPRLVGDIKVECTIQPSSGEGELGFAWTFRGRQVSASVFAGGEVYRDIYYLSREELDVHEDAGGFPLALGGDEYCMLGDNSGQSRDARFFGPVTEDALYGVARWIHWPVSRWREFR